jgi:hypothetical protein
MLTVSHRHDILRTIIIFDAIDMVRFFAFWERLIISLFPDQDGTLNVTVKRTMSLTCSRMIRLVDIDISTRGLRNSSERRRFITTSRSL